LLVLFLRLNAIFILQNVHTYILLDYGDVGYPPLDRGLVEVGDVGIPFERVAVACKNNDFGLEPREAALDSAAKRVPICELFEDVNRRNSTITDVIKDQNIGEFASVEPFSGVVWGFDPFIQAVVFIEPPALTCPGGPNPYIHFRDLAVGSQALETCMLV